MDIEHFKTENSEGIKAKVTIPILDRDDMLNIDINMSDIVNEFSRQIIKDKDLAVAQYIIQKQQKIIDKAIKYTQNNGINWGRANGEKYAMVDEFNKAELLKILEGEEVDD